MTGLLLPWRRSEDEVKEGKAPLPPKGGVTRKRGLVRKYKHKTFPIRYHYRDRLTQQWRMIK